MITLDEAIRAYTSNAEYERTHDNLQGCLDFRQLTEWLKELKQLREQEPCENCISRQAVLDVLDKSKYSNEFCEEHHIDWSINLGMAHIVVNELEPVTPQPKTGHWIDRFPAKECKCSVCDFLICISNGSYIDMVGQMKYCPNCGAKMVEPQGSEGKE